MTHRSYSIEGTHGFSIVHEPHNTPQPWDWVVQLPHQCDEWEIASGKTAQDAIADLDTFIAEAQQTRTKLGELATEPRT